jgi:hypothetical protein
MKNVCSIGRFSEIGYWIWILLIHDFESPFSRVQYGPRETQTGGLGRRLWSLRNTLNRLKIILSNNLLTDLIRLIVERKFDWFERSLLSFGVGITFAWLHLVGKYDSFRQPLNK